MSSIDDSKQAYFEIILDWRTYMILFMFLAAYMIGFTLSAAIPPLDRFAAGFLSAFIVCAYVPFFEGRVGQVGSREYPEHMKK